MSSCPGRKQTKRQASLTGGVIVMSKNTFEFCYRYTAVQSKSFSGDLCAWFTGLEILMHSLQSPSRVSLVGVKETSNLSRRDL